MSTSSYPAGPDSPRSDFEFELELEPGPRLKPSPHPLQAPRGAASAVAADETGEAGPRAAGLEAFAANSGVGRVIKAINTDLHGTLNDPGYADGSGWEDNVAQGGGVVFYTGNWFAAYSTDGGYTFNYINPETAFPADDGGFGADQLVRYIPQLNEFVWLLQYDTTGPHTENRDRLAFLTPQEIIANRATGWRYWDVRSAAVGQTKRWLDFPDLSVGQGRLYLASNVFDRRPDGTSDSVGGVFARMPLSTFAAPQPGVAYQQPGLPIDYMYDANGYGFRVAQFQPGRAAGARRVVWARHNGDSQIRVYYADEDSSQFVWRDVKHPTIPGAQGKAGKWINDVDTRLISGTRTGDEAWFSWSAARAYKASDETPRYPWPHIEIARIAVPELTLVKQRNIYSSKEAFGFPMLATNKSGEVGIALEYGADAANFAVGILTGEVHLVQSATGERLGGGHYQGITASGDFPDLFAAAGRVERSDPAATGAGGFGNHAYYALFGRSDDIPAPKFVEPPPSQPPPPAPPGGVSLTCPYQFQNAFSNVVATGRVGGVGAGEGVDVLWQHGTDPRIIDSATTAADGTFSVTRNMDGFGTWTVVAHFRGNAAYGPADSATCSFSVSPPPR